MMTPFFSCDWRVISLARRLGEPANVVHGEAFADQRAPASGAEGDQVLLLLTAWAVETLLQDELGFLQVLGRVDALHFVLIVNLVALDAQAGADQLVHTISQPILAIDRTWRQPLQSSEDDGRVDDVRSDIDLMDCAHLRGRFRAFDDVDDLAARVADDASVGQRTIHHRGEQRQMRLPQFVTIEQPADRIRPEQRRVAIEDEQVAGDFGECLARLQHGISGAQRLLLRDIVKVRTKLLLHFFLAGRNHNVDVGGGDHLQCVVHDRLQDALLAKLL